MDLKKTALGIELGSTRIKAVLIDEKHLPIASGDYEWENQLVDGIWTYSMQAIHTGLRACFAALREDVKTRFGQELTTVGAIGVSAMMHGYLPFDKDGKQLAEFRTWRNTITGEAAGELTELFGFNIPQRWSIAHLYQAVLNREEHVKDVAFLTTLAGYIHWQLTGEKVMGVGEASGMFPIDSSKLDYDETMIRKFKALTGIELRDILPRVLTAGQSGGVLTEAGARFLDPSGTLQPGIPVAPCEGDAGTGMAATNSVRVHTGNVSAGTSDFAMIVTDKPLGVHREIDMVTTPDGAPVAMVHCNNCTSDINAWVNLFSQFAEAIGAPVEKGQLFTLLFRKALEGEPDCGGLLSYNYFSGEGVTDLDQGRPLFVRTPDASFTLANFMRTHLYPDPDRAGPHRQAHRSRRLLQDSRRGSADAVGGGGFPGHRDGDGGGGRPLRYGPAGRLHALEGRGREPGRLPGQQGVLRRQGRHRHGRRQGRCGLQRVPDPVPEGPGPGEMRHRGDLRCWKN